MQQKGEIDNYELLGQIAAGSEQAFQTLFESYRGRLYQYVLGIVKSREVAEELVIDVFLKIWLGRDVVTQIENIDGFLFRVACNKSIDFLRKASREPTLTDVIWDHIQFPGSQNAEARLIQEEYEKTLRDAIELLPPKRQQIYRLSREEGLSHAEIGEQLGIAPSTIANQMVEAQRFIKTYLLKQLNIFILFALMVRI